METLVGTIKDRHHKYLSSRSAFRHHRESICKKVFRDYTFLCGRWRVEGNNEKERAVLAESRSRADVLAMDVGVIEWDINVLHFPSVFLTSNS